MQAPARPMDYLNHVVGEVVASPGRLVMPGRTIRDEAAVEAGPVQGPVMIGQIGAAMLAAIERDHASARTRSRIAQPRPREPECTRTKARQHRGRVPSVPGLDDLSMACSSQKWLPPPMVPSAASKSVRARSASVIAGDIAVPRLTEFAQAFGRLVEPELARRDVELVQAHAAADIRADEFRVDASARMAQPTGPYLPGCRSGMAGDRLMPGGPRRIKLMCGIALDPGFGRGEAVDRRTAAHKGKEVPIEKLSGDLRNRRRAQRRQSLA